MWSWPLREGPCTGNQWTQSSLGFRSLAAHWSNEDRRPINTLFKKNTNGPGHIVRLKNNNIIIFGHIDNNKNIQVELNVGTVLATGGKVPDIHLWINGSNYNMSSKTYDNINNNKIIFAIELTYFVLETKYASRELLLSPKCTRGNTFS